MVSSCLEHAALLLLHELFLEHPHAVLPSRVHLGLVELEPLSPSLFLGSCVLFGVRSFVWLASRHPLLPWRIQQLYGIKPKTTRYSH